MYGGHGVQHGSARASRWWLMPWPQSSLQSTQAVRGVPLVVDSSKVVVVAGARCTGGHDAPAPAPVCGPRHTESAPEPLHTKLWCRNRGTVRTVVACWTLPLNTVALLWTCEPWDFGYCRGTLDIGVRGTGGSGRH